MHLEGKSTESRYVFHNVVKHVKFGREQIEIVQFFKRILVNIFRNQIFSIVRTSPICRIKFSGFLYSSWLTMSKYDLWTDVNASLSSQHIAWSRIAARKVRRVSTAAQSFPSSFAFRPVEENRTLDWHDLWANGMLRCNPETKMFLIHRTRTSLHPFCSQELQDDAIFFAYMS